MEIIIWDDNAARIMRMEAAVHSALLNMRLHLRVSSNCEPPLLARNNLYGKTPALEINGQFWSKTPPRELNAADVEKLLRRVLPLQAEEPKL